MPNLIGFSGLRNSIFSLSVALLCASDAGAQPGIPIGQMPKAVAFNEVTNKLYVANTEKGNAHGSVTVIDGNTYAATTVAVGVTPSDIAVNSKTNKIFVSNLSDANVTVIDGTTNTTHIINAGAGASAIAINERTNKIYVCNVNSDVSPNRQVSTVTVIDGSNYSTETVRVSRRPFAIAINELTNRIYVTSEGGIAVIDGLTNAPVILKLRYASINTSSVVDQTKDKVYVASQAVPTVTVIDGRTNNLSVIPVGASGQVRGMVINSITHKIYVTNGQDGSLSIIDGATNAVVNVPVLPGIFRIAVNASTNKIYMLGGYKPPDFSSLFTVVDGATNSVATLPMPTVSGIYGALAVDKKRNNIYLTGFADFNKPGEVIVIDGATFKRIR